jgi:hypothetical protein
VTRRVAAYTAYAAGSGLFLGIALSRGSLLVAAASALFLIGTLLLLTPEAARLKRGAGRRATRGKGSA